MQALGSERYFEELFKTGNTVEIWLKYAFLFITAFLALFLIYNEYWIIAGGLAGGIAATYLFLVKPVYWIYATVMFFPVYAHSRDEDIGAEDITAGVIYNMILMIWFATQIFIKRNKIVRNLSDWIILFLFIILLFHSAINFMNDSDILSWAREYLVMSIILLYFPVREYIKTRKDLKNLLIIFSVSTIINAFLQFKFFYDLINTIEMNYAYQLLMGLRINQFYFTAAALFGLFFFFHQKKLLHFLYLAIVTVMSFGAMFISLSRTYWVFFIAGVGLFFISLPAKKKIIFVQFSLASLALFLAVVFTFWQDNAMLYLQALETRFLSTTKGKKDVSLLMRSVEYSAVYEKIKLYPIGGSGLNKKYHFYDKYRGFAIYDSNIHNGYLSLTYRAGIVIAIVYFMFYIMYLTKLLTILPKARDSLLKPLALGTLATLLLFFASNITSGQFIYKEAVFTMGFVIGFVGILENIILSEDNGNSIIH